MKPKNKYAKFTKISEGKFRETIKCFSLDLNATQTAKLTNLNRNTINRYYAETRRKIVEHQEKNSPINGKVEVDESYFGSHRTRGKQGSGASNKTIVFGLFKRNGRVYTEIVSNCSKPTFQAIIGGKVNPESVIHSDSWPGYNGLVDVGFEKHFRVEHGKNEFSKGNGNRINRIESFWRFAKNRFSKFNGVSKENFYTYLKEYEFRFNHKGIDFYKFLLSFFRNNSPF
jgi:transposase-like protein